MSQLIIETRGLDISRALDGAFGVIGRRWSAVLFVILVVGWVPQVVLLLTSYPVVSRLTSGTSALIATIAFDLTMLFVAMFLRVSITALALAPDAPTQNALAAALRAIPALTPLWLIASVPNLARPLMLSVTHASVAQQAGVMTVISWPLAVVIACSVGVASAVAVSERGGFFATMSRAFRLMAGGRWTFLGAFLVFQVLASLSALAISLAFTLLPTASLGDIRAFGVARTILADLSLGRGPGALGRGRRHVLSPVAPPAGRRDD